MKNFFAFITVSFFALAVNVTAIEYVRPCGEAVGIKMYTDGLLVVGVDGNKDGIRMGDIIVAANGNELSRIEDLSKITAENKTAINLTIKRNEEIIDLTVNPMPADDGSKLGLWVRDSTAGIGTLTFISTDGTEFAALGHGITDVDTGNILPLKSGNILNCTQIFAKKSCRGMIGELGASFDRENIGDICINSKKGIYGTISNIDKEKYKEMPVATADEIHEGEVSVMCNIGDGVKEYCAEIKKVSKNNEVDKALVIEITDKELIEKTGGIVQGMSGSPILQDGKLVGAVTHVFVNDPTRGYGIFIENMLAESEKIK